MLVLTFGALALAAIVLAATLAPAASTLERAVAASVLVPAMAVGIVYALGALHAITPLAWALTSTLAGLAVVVALGPSSRATLHRDAAELRDAWREIVREPLTLVMLAPAAIAIGLSTLAAGALEPWAWDALGYHLPIVHDAMQTHTLRVVPTSVIYVNCYPRLLDVFFVAWRLCLGDETWIEAGQLPFTIVGVTSIAAIVRRAGPSTGRSLAQASLWAALPIVMLQLATAYIDVAVGALCLATFVLVTSSLHGRAELLAGVAAGLLLGSKPSAPPLVAVALVTLLVRAHRARRLRAGVLGAAVALAIGAWKYLENVALHGNPIWPVTLVLGPLELPGRISMAELSASNLPEPYRSMGWAARVASSWTTIDSDRWVFDMRLGGFGPLFTLGLLPAIAMLSIGAARSERLRERLAPVALPLVLVVVATLATLGAFWSRYTMAVPGAFLAAVVVASSELELRWRRAGQLAFVALALSGLGLSWRGLTDGGPSLFEILALPPEERVTAYAVDAQEADWRAARARVGPDEAFGYDACFGLPGRLRRRDGTGHIAFFGEAPSEAALTRWIEDEHVRVLALHDGPEEAASIARAHPERFEELFESEYPDWQPCVVFVVR
ncbi:MAG: hypothetical protein K1X94_21140 [Sandaracinaceae bacterium]|nr:hypothetical protein [Sandaracinaceae bacterium]